MTEQQYNRYFRAIHSIAKLEIDISKTERKNARALGWRDAEAYHTRRIAEIERIRSVYERGAITPAEAMKMILEAGNKEDGNCESNSIPATAGVKGKTAEADSKKPEVFYTGGGIWISAISIDETHYYTTDNDSEGWLYIYDRTGEDTEDEFGEYEFPCQNIVGEIHKSQMDEEQKAYYRLLRKALQDEAF